ncbi:MAG: phospholipid carrier-dependent glycosyltransferase [Candidatus Kaelpia imicola]|nr:phospholipid carrier-dependent glycosyltransferase [Candidatus Kaelpia imicola]
MIKSTSFRSGVFIVLFLALLLAFANYLYLLKSDDIFTGDQVAHITNSVRCYRSGFDIFNKRQGFALYLISSLLYHLFPLNYYTAILSNIFFSLLLFGSVYAMVLKIKQKKSAAMFAAFLIAVYPISFGLSRFYLLEYSLMSWVALFYMLLLYCNNFKNRFYTVLAALVLGLGPITKESFFIYVIPVIIYKFCLVIKDRSVNIERIRLNLLFFLSFSFLASFWFFSSPKGIINEGLCRLLREGGNNPDISWFSLRNITFYLYPLVDFNLSPFYAFLFVSALVVFFKNRFKFKRELVIWFIMPFIIFSLFPWKLARYIAAVTPAAAVITSLGISTFGKYLRRSLYLFSVIFGLVQFLTLSYGLYPFKANCFIRTEFLSKLFSLTPNRYCEDFEIATPNKSYSGSLEILDAFDEFRINMAGGAEPEEIKVCRVLNVKSKSGYSVEHSISSMLPYFNEVKGHYSIDYCYLDESRVLNYFEGSRVEDLDKFDIFLFYQPELSLYIEGNLRLYKELSYKTGNIDRSISIFYDADKY